MSARLRRCCLTSATFSGLDLDGRSLTCGFGLGDCWSCALGAAVFWAGVPVSADGQDVLGRDGGADRAFVAARVAGYRAPRVGA